MVFLASIVILSSLILPESFSLIFFYLTVKIGGSGLPPLFSVGEADFLISDLIIVTVFFKLLFRAALGAALGKYFKSLLLAGLLPGLVAFVGAMILSVFISYIRFGEDVFRMELVPLLRFLYLQIGGFILLIVSLRTIRHVQKAQTYLYCLGYLAAVSIYIGLILQPFGINLGEINTSEQFIRYQGFIGDSVKLFLLPFIFFEVLSRRFLKATFLSIALLATGGRFGFLGLLVGLALILATERKRLFRPRHLIAFATVVMFIGIPFLFDVGGMATRSTNPGMVEIGLGRRVVTWDIGHKMAVEHFLTGLGFGAYRIFYDAYCSDVPWSFTPFVTETFSQVLKALVDGGIWGLGAFLWMMINFITVMKKAIEGAKGETQVFLKAGYVFSVTLFILSPFVAWLLPASWVSYLFFMFAGIGVRLSKTYHFRLRYPHMNYMEKARLQI